MRYFFKKDLLLRKVKRFIYIFIFIKRAPRTVPRHASILLGLNEDPVVLSYRCLVSITVQLCIDWTTDTAPSKIHPGHRIDFSLHPSAGCSRGQIRIASAELPPHLSNLGHPWCQRPQPSLPLGFREPQSLWLPRHWGWKRHAKVSTALHWHCSCWINMVSQRTRQVWQALQLFHVNPTSCSPFCCWSTSVRGGGHQGWSSPLHSAIEVIH